MICVEAIQTILDLTESYAKLFSLRQTPCFIPYFVFAAGLTRIVLSMDAPRANLGVTAPDMDSSSPQTDPEPPSQSDDAEETRDMAYTSGTDASDTVPVTDDRNAYTSDPGDDGGLTGAVSQLKAMSDAHPAACQAGWVLRSFKPRHSYPH